MKSILLASAMGAALLLHTPARSQVYRDPKADVETRVSDLLGRMTLDEKIGQLSGLEGTDFDTRENTRLGIPAFRMSDGPLGVRWEKSTAFPCGAAIAATWDTALVARFAFALAEETHAHGRNYLLGPCVNIHRFPAGGRNFESYGEDPYLAGRMAVSYVRALQKQDVIPSVKHFALNNQEWQRTTINVVADERAMREIYLPAFEAAVKEGGAWSVMSAYNKVNGWWCSENKHLLTDILKDEWGFRGLVVSDWESTHSTVYAANNGLDLEMPKSNVFSMANLKKSIAAGEVTEETINERVRRILRVKFLAGLFDKTLNPDSTILTAPSHRQLALEMAEESTVLLKNDGNVLPLDQERTRTVAVIGPNAATARTGGGGSSHVNPCYSISPLEGIKKLLGERVNVVYAPGDELHTTPVLPVAGRYLAPGASGGRGLRAEYFGNLRLENSPGVTRTDTTLYFDWGDDPPMAGIAKDDYSVRWSGFLTPPVTRKYTLYTVSDDGVRLFLGDKVLIDNWSDHGTTVDSALVELVAGKSYPVKIEYYEHGGSAVLLFGWDLPMEKQQSRMMADAVKAARSADVAIVFAGTSDSYESEGFDRTGGLALPGKQDELISAVAAANPRTIVVLNTGTPVITRRWLDRVPVLLETFFPGQEGGTAIANILFGKHNPSGRLPFSFISGYEQSPAYKGYMDKSLEAPYSEGIFVGYRYLEKNNLAPTFPFGHGLSYTTFSYSGLKAWPLPGGNYRVTLNVKNTGKVAGTEVVQLYVADDHSSVPRPVKELKAFSRIYLEPGREGVVTMYLDRRSFAWYDVPGKKWKVEPGNFILLAGSSSADIRQKITVAVN